MPSNSPQTSLFRRTAGVAGTLAVVGLTLGACSSTDSDSPATSATAAAGQTTGAATATGDTEYRNGEYSATGEYQTPGGTQSIGVTLTLDNDVVTAVNLDRSHTRGTSAEFQEKFDSGIDGEVVGKNINDLDVSKVAGSSLTSGGFNAAVSEIKSEARA